VTWPTNWIPITNDDGELIGAEPPDTGGTYYDDQCGFSHPDGMCPLDREDPDDYDEEDDYCEPEDHDFGPEVDDQGGMTEFRFYPQDGDPPF
jgi:hypothetical protein